MDLTQATFNFGLLAKGTIDTNIPKAENDAVIDQDAQFGATDPAIHVTPSTTRDATKCVPINIALTAGAQTIDLTAIPFGGLSNLDMTGLRLIGYRLEGAAANTDRLSMDVGATNGYQFCGNANGFIEVGAGGQNQHYDPDVTNPAPVVGASAKDLDFASSDVDAKGSLILIFGS